MAASESTGERADSKRDVLDDIRYISTTDKDIEGVIIHDPESQAGAEWIKSEDVVDRVDWR